MYTGPNNINEEHNWDKIFMAFKTGGPYLEVPFKAGSNVECYFSNDENINTYQYLHSNYDVIWNQF